MLAHYIVASFAYLSKFGRSSEPFTLLGYFASDYHGPAPREWKCLNGLELTTKSDVRKASQFQKHDLTGTLSVSASNTPYLQPSSYRMAAVLTQPLPADYFVKTHQFTKTVHRDQYPSIDPASPKLSQKGKTVIVTGASQGLGKVDSTPSLKPSIHILISPSDRASPLHLLLQMRPELSLRVATRQSSRQLSKSCSRSTPLLMSWFSQRILLPKIA